VLCVQLEMEFFRVTNISIRKTFMAKLDAHLEIIISILCAKGGSTGRKIAQQLGKCDLASTAHWVTLYSAETEVSDFSLRLKRRSKT